MGSMDTQRASVAALAENTNVGVVDTEIRPLPRYTTVLRSAVTVMLPAAARWSSGGPDGFAGSTMVQPDAQLPPIGLTVTLVLRLIASDRAFRRA